MISALIPFLLKSPPTSATHKTPWLGATAENATLTLSAAGLGMAKRSASRIVNPTTTDFSVPNRDLSQTMMAPAGFFVCAAACLVWSTNLFLSANHRQRKFYE